MKLLLINESPLTKIGVDYYAVDPWVRFPTILAEHCERLTLWTTVAEHHPETPPPAGSWRVALGPLRIEPHDNYHTFVQYYRQCWRKRRRWRRHAEQLIDAHDVVILRHPSPMLPLIARTARRLKKPFVVLLVGDIARQSDRILGSRGLKRLAYQALVTWWVRQEIRWCRTASLLFVYSQELVQRHRQSAVPIRAMQTPHLRQRDICERADTCQQGAIRLIRVCWLIPSKGLEDLLDAVALLVNQKIDTRLQIVGRERVAGYQATLEQRAIKLGIRDRIDFHGWVPFDCLQGLYQHADIHVVSSLAEGTPRVLVEAAAAGLPQVCTTVGGSVDCLEHGKTALLVPPHAPDAMASAIASVATDAPLRRSLIRNGYALARAASFETLGQRFLTDLREILPPSRNGHDLNVLALAECAATEGWNAAAYRYVTHCIRQQQSPMEDERVADWRYLLPLHRNTRALVLGSGLGTVPIALAEQCGQVDVLDTAKAALALLEVRCHERRLDNLSLTHLETGRAFPLSERSFDLVTVGATWHGAMNIETMLGAIYPLLTDGGIVHLQVHNVLAFQRLLQGRWRSTKWRTLWGYRRLLRECGFSAAQFYAPLPHHEGIPMFYLPLADRRVIDFFFRSIFPLFDAVSPEVKATYGWEYRAAKAGVRCARVSGLARFAKYVVPSYMIVARKGGEHHAA